jgi:DNA-binding NtrC family response regulator
MTTALIPSALAAATTPPLECHAMLNLLVVDDDRAVRASCHEAAAALGYRVTTTESGEQAVWLIESQSIDVVLLGLRLCDAARLGLLRQIKRRRPSTEIVVMSTNDRAQPAVDALKGGACDYLTKPFGLRELQIVLGGASARLQQRIADRELGQKIQSNGFGKIIGRAPEMEKVYRIIARAAQTNHPVLILGESGTGKELVARAIHYSGPFRDKPFVPVDCGSLVPTLIESELFGYVKGAFTGATQSKQGLLSIADGGTVFLDEIGELALDMQAKLLRALQEREIRPVGGTKAVPINIRILAATNRDLEQAVSNGAFRRDLFYRLNVLSLKIPPRRERRQDVLS